MKIKTNIANVVIFTFAVQIMSCFNIGLTLPTVQAADYTAIYDNKSKSLSTIGDWKSKTDGSGYIEQDYLVSSGGTATFSLPVEKTGNYKIYLRWPEVSEITKKAIVNIKDAEGEIFTVPLNQTINGGYWVLTGTYFLKKDGKQVLTITSGNGENVAVDAVRCDLSREVAKKAKTSWYEGAAENNTSSKQEVKPIEINNSLTRRSDYTKLPRITSFMESIIRKPLPSAPVGSSPVPDEGGLIFDNTSPEFSTKGGTWVSESNPLAEGKSYMSDSSIDDDYLQIASWSPILKDHGIYEVYMKWPDGENRPDLAKVIIKNFKGMDGTKTINQTKDAGKWNLIGRYEFRSGKGNSVILEANSRGFTAADAVKFKLVSKEGLQPLPTPFPIPEKIEDQNLKEYRVVVDDTDRYRITCDGEIYNINGIGLSTTAVGLEEAIKYFKEAGGNSFRTYGDTALYEGNLDYAYDNGLTVMAGIWIPKTSELDYSNKKLYTEYVNRQKKAIDTFKDHPALAFWSVNNESEGSDTQGEVYAMIEEVTRYIKKVDPYHPVTTVFAGSSVTKQEKLMEFAPSVDILSINSYKGIASCYPSTVDSGWRGPLIVSEYGPDGTWECSRTSWGVVLEMPNDEKADLYRTRHLTNIMNNNKGVGGYAFCLPYAVGYEGTLTWYGFIFNGKKTPIMHEMQYAWTGKYADNVAPRVKSVMLNNKKADENIILAPSDDIELEITVTDRENDTLTYGFEIREEVNTSVTDKYPRLIEKVDNLNTNKAKMKVPSVPGYYRVYAYAYDGHDNVGVDNIPIYVKQTKTGVVTEVKNPEKVKELLAKAAEEIASNTKISADVNVNITENINGIIYGATGEGEVATDGISTHISSSVKYHSSGLQNSDMFISGKTLFTKDKDGKWIKTQLDNAFNIMNFYKLLSEDKSIFSELTVDETTEQGKYIMRGNVFAEGLYSNALRGYNNMDFVQKNDAVDKYSLEIHIDKNTGRIINAVAMVGYTVSAAEGKYNDIEYTYNYTYNQDLKISLPQ